MLASVSRSFSIVANASCIAADSPIIDSSTLLPAPLSTSTCSFSRLTSQRERRNLIPDESVASSFSFSHGFGMKSVAPALMARTALSVSAYAVIKITTA